MASEIKVRSVNKTSEIVNFIIALLLMFCFKFLPAPDPITPYGMALIGVFIGLIYGWCTLSDTLPASLIGLVALGAAIPSGVFGALVQLFSGYVPILMIISFFMVGALMGAEVAEYLVYKVCTAKFALGRPWLLMAVIFYGSWTVGVFTNIMIVTLFLLAIYPTLFKQAGFKPGEKTPVMIVMFTCIFCLLGSVVFPWGPPTIMVISAAEAIGVSIPYSKYIMTIFLFSYMFIGLSLILMKVMRCEVKRFTEIDFSFLEGKYVNGLTAHQKGVLICVLASCFGCLLISFLPSWFPLYAYISTNLTIIGWMALIVGVMLFVQIDGKRLLPPSDMARFFTWDIFFIVALGVTIGTMLPAAETGIGTWLSMAFGPVLGGASGITLCIFATLAALFLTNFLNNNVVVILLATIVITLCAQGIIGDPIPALVMIIIAGDIGYYTPSASFAGALNHAHTYTTPGAIYKYGAIVFVYTAVVCVVLLQILVKLIF